MVLSWMNGDGSLKDTSLGAATLSHTHLSYKDKSDACHTPYGVVGQGQKDGS